MNKNLENIMSQNNSSNEIKKKNDLDQRTRTNHFPEIKGEQFTEEGQDSKDSLGQVFLEGQKIIDVAKLLGIKPKIARTVISFIRKQNRKKKNEETKYCGISKLKANQIQKIKIISMTSGRITNTLDHSYQGSQSIS